MLMETQKPVEKKNIDLNGVFQEDAQTIYNICTACMGYDTCTFPIDSSKPSLHCAEFKPFPSRSANDFKKTPSQAAEASSMDKPEYSGLCRNCELKNDCTFSGVGKSILNCDEYQ